MVLERHNAKTHGNKSIAGSNPATPAFLLGKMTTPENITHLESNEIFVFGSNYAGRHGKGAALTALKKFGAGTMVSEGLMGKSYGIPTKDAHLRPLRLVIIGASVLRFLTFSRLHPELRFLVTPIGCGLAGYKPKDIAPFFRNAPGNVILPASFVAVLSS